MVDLAGMVREKVETIKGQLGSRSYRVANELRNSAQIVLRGKRSGRQYGAHIASAPGEPPASDRGKFRESWEPGTETSGDVYVSKIENGLMANGYVLGEILEDGTPGGQMAPRPHHDRILDKTKGKARRIYSEPYF